MEMEKKTWEKLFVIIAFILSIVAILNSFFNINIKTISIEGSDVVGWSVGILQVSITIVVSWQIYHVVVFEGKVDEKIKSVSENLEEHINQEIEKQTLTTNVKICQTLGFVFTQSNDSFNAIIWYMEAIDYLLKLPNNEVSINIEISYVRKEVEKVQNEQDIMIDSRLQNKCLKVLYQIENNVDVKYLLDFFKSLKTNDC